MARIRDNYELYLQSVKQAENKLQEKLSTSGQLSYSEFKLLEFSRQLRKHVEQAWLPPSNLSKNKRTTILENLSQLHENGLDENSDAFKALWDNTNLQGILYDAQLKLIDQLERGGVNVNGAISLLEFSTKEISNRLLAQAKNSGLLTAMPMGKRNQALAAINEFYITRLTKPEKSHLEIVKEMQLNKRYSEIKDELDYMHYKAQLNQLDTVLKSDLNKTKNSPSSKFIAQFRDLLMNENLKIDLEVRNQGLKALEEFCKDPDNVEKRATCIKAVNDFTDAYQKSDLSKYTKFSLGQAGIALAFAGLAVLTIFAWPIMVPAIGFLAVGYFIGIVLASAAALFGLTSGVSSAVDASYAIGTQRTVSKISNEVEDKIGNYGSSPTNQSWWDWLFGQSRNASTVEKNENQMHGSIRKKPNAATQFLGVENNRDQTQHMKENLSNLKTQKIEEEFQKLLPLINNSIFETLGITDFTGMDENVVQNVVKPTIDVFAYNLIEQDDKTGKMSIKDLKSIGDKEKKKLTVVLGSEDKVRDFLNMLKEKLNEEEPSAEAGLS